METAKSGRRALGHVPEPQHRGPAEGWGSSARLPVRIGRHGRPDVRQRRRRGGGGARQVQDVSQPAGRARVGQEVRAGAPEVFGQLLLASLGSIWFDSRWDPTSIATDLFSFSVVRRLRRSIRSLRWT